MGPLALTVSGGPPLNGVPFGQPSPTAGASGARLGLCPLPPVWGAFTPVRKRARSSNQPQSRTERGPAPALSGCSPFPAISEKGLPPYCECADLRLYN